MRIICSSGVNWVARCRWLFILAAVVICQQQASGQLAQQLTRFTYNQNFNGLAVSGSGNNSSTLPIGFAFSEAGTGNNVTYAASDGSTSTPNTYSFGTGTNTDRALGEITGTLQSTLGAAFVNNTGFTIPTFVVGYTGEQWRLGDSAAPVDKLDFQFSTTATALNTGTYQDVSDLDFSSPNNAAGSVGALNGNSAANRTIFDPFAITPSTPIAPGATFFIRWVPLNAAGSNDGLGIDNFSLGFTLIPNLAGDFNADGNVDALDIDLLMHATQGRAGDLKYDLNHNNNVQSTPLLPGSDSDIWVKNLAATRYGDANLDLMVNTADFNVMASNFSKTFQTWANGDFNGDGRINALDFNALATNFGYSLYSPTVDAASVNSLAQVVPEPAVSAMAALLSLAAFGKRCRMSQDLI